MSYLYTIILPAVVGIVSILVGFLMIFKPALAIEIQRRFYEKINWRISPISMAKEIRNTMIMGMVVVILSLFIFVICISSAFGQADEEDGSLSSGTEKINIGPAAALMIPKGAVVDTKDGVLRAEGTGSFSGRKFKEVEMRLEKIERNQQELREKLEQLVTAVETLQKKGNNNQQK